MDDVEDRTRPLNGTWVLVAGADPVVGKHLRARLAAAGCSAVEIATDLEEAAERYASARPDAVIAMPGLGPALRRRLDPIGLQLGPPVLGLDEIPGLLSGDAGDPASLDHLGAVMELHKLRARTRDLEAMLASDALKRHRELDEVRADSLRRLARAAEYRDDNTWEHTQRVAATAARLGRRMGMDDGTVELLRHAAPLHDIGKIAIPEYILLKPDKLTDEEFEVVKTHSAIGASILAGGDSEVLRIAERIAATHHERWDGSGYPDRLRGEDIPLVGRLVALADTFDVLLHERPWKEEWTLEDATEEILRSAGGHFDPAVVSAFEDLGPATLLALADEVEGG